MHIFFKLILKLLSSSGKIAKVIKTISKGITKSLSAAKMLKLAKTAAGFKNLMRSLNIKQIKSLENLIANFSTRLIKATTKQILKKQTQVKYFISQLQKHDLRMLTKTLSKMEARDQIKIYKDIFDYLSNKKVLSSKEQELFNLVEEKLPKKQKTKKSNRIKTGMEFASLHSSWISGAIYNFDTGEALVETFSLKGGTHSFLVSFNEYEWYAFKAMRGKITNGAGSWLWHNQKDWMLKRRKTFRIVISPYTKRLMTLEKNKYGENMDEYLHKIEPEAWIKTNFSNSM